MSCDLLSFWAGSWWSIRRRLLSAHRQAQGAKWYLNREPTDQTTDEDVVVHAEMGRRCGRAIGGK